MALILRRLEVLGLYLSLSLEYAAVFVQWVVGVTAAVMKGDEGRAVVFLLQ